MVMNIGGGAKAKLTGQHPFIDRIREKHDPNLLFIIDARDTTMPDWLIKGYKRILFLPGDNTKYMLEVYKDLQKGILTQK